MAFVVLLVSLDFENLPAACIDFNMRYLAVCLCDLDPIGEVAVLIFKFCPAFTTFPGTCFSAELMAESRDIFAIPANPASSSLLTWMLPVCFACWADTPPMAMRAVRTTLPVTVIILFIFIDLLSCIKSVSLTSAYDSIIERERLQEH